MHTLFDTGLAGGNCQTLSQNVSSGLVSLIHLH